MHTYPAYATPEHSPLPRRFLNKPFNLYRCTLSASDFFPTSLEHLATYLAQMSYTHLLVPIKDDLLNYPLHCLSDTFCKFGIGIIFEITESIHPTQLHQCPYLRLAEGLFFPYASENEIQQLGVQFPQFCIFGNNSLPYLPYESEAQNEPIASQVLTSPPLSEKYRSFFQYDDLFQFLRAYSCYLKACSILPITQCGDEIAQFDPCPTPSSFQNHLLSYSSHRNFQRFHAELNSFYLHNSLLWQNKKTIKTDDSRDSIAIICQNKLGEALLCCINFSASAHSFYIDKPSPSWSPVFASDCDIIRQTQIINEENQRTCFVIPRLSAVYFQTNTQYFYNSGGPSCSKRKK